MGPKTWNRSALERNEARVLRSLPGRETLELGPNVVKRSRERWGLGRSPGAVEYQNLRDLARDGIPVPRALSWSAERSGPLLLARHSEVEMERIEHRETLRERLFQAPPAERAQLGEKLLALVVRLHQSGWYHRDLYLQHIVLRGDELVLLDVGRARQGRSVRARWFVKDLAALLHSCPRSVTPRERLRFLRAYLRARGIEGRPSWLRAIQRRERRMARHVPKHGETQPWEDL